MLGFGRQPWLLAIRNILFTLPCIPWIHNTEFRRTQGIREVHSWWKRNGFRRGRSFFYQSSNNEDIINEIELTVENQRIKYSLRPKIKDRFPNSQSLNFREVAKKLVRTELEMDETKSRTYLVKMLKYFENLKTVSSLFSFREVLKDELEWKGLDRTIGMESRRIRSIDCLLLRT